MVFHPTCFEIFTRTSRLRLGFVDANGLAGWRRLDHQKSYHEQLRHHPAVREGEEQWWIHNSGDAWLAANPVVVPGLPARFEAALRCDTDKKSVNTMRPGYSSDKDPLVKLPRELVDAILGFLIPKDVASLRLAGGLTYLPLSHWRNVFREEMPWIWEMWDDVEPSIWATLSYGAMRAEIEKRKVLSKRLEEDHELYKTIILEDMPEVWEAYKNDHPWLQMDSSKFKELDLSNLPTFPTYETISAMRHDEINWCRAFYEISTWEDEVKGLRNRKRIWEAVEEIIRRIIAYREEGRIED